MNLVIYSGGGNESPISKIGAGVGWGLANGSSYTTGRGLGHGSRRGYNYMDLILLNLILKYVIRNKTS